VIAVFGALLPLAVVVALSPTVITVLTVLVVSSDSRLAVVAFAVGYTTGLALLLVLFLTLSGLADLAESAARIHLAGWLLVVIGVALIGLSIRQWRRRDLRLPDDDLTGGEPATPKWMTAIGDVTVPKVALLSVALAALRPKNVLLVAAASVIIGAAQLPFWEWIVCLVVFVALSASTVDAVAIGLVLREDEMMARLRASRAWLRTNGSAVMSVTLLVIGTVVLGNGLAQLG
jgi:threonine/homoserine/homoserine lactone efflux protein